MPENIPFDGAALRAQALEDLSRAEEETEAELVVASFREGMSAGLDFAYRVVDDFRESRNSPRERLLLDRVLEVLVSEHDMRSAQPIRAIRAERATAQASDEILGGLADLLRGGPRPDPVRPGDPVCDGPCCRPEADPEPENVQAASDARAALRLEHSCDCGEIPGLVSGQIVEGRCNGVVIIHRPEGDPCATGIDLASPTISLEES